MNIPRAAKKILTLGEQQPDMLAVWETPEGQVVRVNFGRGSYLLVSALGAVSVVRWPTSTKCHHATPY